MRGPITPGPLGGLYLPPIVKAAQPTVAPAGDPKRPQ
jgi:hypothetical protein